MTERERGFYSRVESGIARLSEGGRTVLLLSYVNNNWTYSLSTYVITDLTDYLQ